MRSVHCPLCGLRYAYPSELDVHVREEHAPAAAPERPRDDHGPAVALLGSPSGGCAPASLSHRPRRWRRPLAGVGSAVDTPLRGRPAARGRLPGPETRHAAVAGGRRCPALLAALRAADQPLLGLHRHRPGAGPRGAGTARPAARAVRQPGLDRAADPQRGVAHRAQHRVGAVLGAQAAALPGLDGHPHRAARAGGGRVVAPVCRRHRVAGHLRRRPGPRRRASSS